MNKIRYVLPIGVLFILLIGIAYGAFLDKGKILGSSFSMGSADLKFLNNLTLGAVQTNLVDEKQGPQFTNIGPNWTKDYYTKIYNNATESLTLTSNAYYETINDPDELRSIIFVEIFNWNDDNDGVFEEGELGTSLGRKTIIKWKTEGFNLGQLDTGAIKSLVLKFSTDSVAESKQGKNGTFDFEFGATGVTQ
jgi:hypothetical protein